MNSFDNLNLHLSAGSSSWSSSSLEPLTPPRASTPSQKMAQQIADMRDELASFKEGVTDELAILREEVGNISEMITELSTIIKTRSRVPRQPDIQELHQNVDDDPSLVRIGNDVDTITMQRDAYDRAKSATSGKKLTLKLVNEVFNKDELIMMSYSGKDGKVPLEADHRFKAIAGQVAKSFPRFNSPRKMPALKEAINGRIRTLRRNATGAAARRN